MSTKVSPARLRREQRQKRAEKMRQATQTAGNIITQVWKILHASVLFTFRNFKVITILVVLMLAALAVGVRQSPVLADLVTYVFFRDEGWRAIPQEALPQNGNLVVNSFDGTSRLDVDGSLWQIVATPKTDMFGKVSSVVFHYSVYVPSSNEFQPVEEIDYEIGQTYSGKTLKANEFVWWFE